MVSGVQVPSGTGDFRQSAQLTYLHVSITSSFQTVILASAWHYYSVINIVMITYQIKLQFLRLAFRDLHVRPYCHLSPPYIQMSSCLCVYSPCAKPVAFM